MKSAADIGLSPLGHQHSGFLKDWHRGSDADIGIGLEGAVKTSGSHPCRFEVPSRLPDNGCRQCGALVGPSLCRSGQVPGMEVGPHRGFPKRWNMESVRANLLSCDSLLSVNYGDAVDAGKPLQGKADVLGFNLGMCCDVRGRQHSTAARYRLSRCTTA